MYLSLILLFTAIETSAATCPPGGDGPCNCDWTSGGTKCPHGRDDGSECFCRCCCPYMSQPFTCKWKPPAPPGPVPPPSPPPPPPPPSPPLGPCSSPVVAGLLDIKEYGRNSSVYVVGGSGKKGIEISGNKLVMQYGPRVYFGDKCTDSMEKDMFKIVNWEGRSFSYTVDMSQVGCACNVAVYLVSMPAMNITKCGDYYCDANYVCGVGCPEMDIQEANREAFHVTPHKCDGDQPPYQNCDRGGCGTKVDIDKFGPGKSVIDTNHPFQVNISMSAYAVSTTLSQGAGRSMHLANDCSLGNHFANGMVVTLSSWGGPAKEMSWLDQPPCGNESCNEGAVTYSDFEIV
eukprot:m.338776 g.338776  ORF g.338776 m.338776 type:complete len:346 (-) comp18542_c0_seq1:128-1165(-)